MTIDHTLSKLLSKKASQDALKELVAYNIVKALQAAKDSNQVDITLCSGLGCPLSKSCFRALAKGNPEYQSYFMGIPLKEDGTCDYYGSIE
jgi:hypothetical protein